MYNGFRFSDEDIRVYNPYSIAKAYDITKLQLLQNEKVIIIRCFI